MHLTPLDAPPFKPTIKRDGDKVLTLHRVVTIGDHRVPEGAHDYTMPDEPGSYYRVPNPSAWRMLGGVVLAVVVLGVLALVMVMGS